MTLFPLFPLNLVSKHDVKEIFLKAFNTTIAITEVV